MRFYQRVLEFFRKINVRIVSIFLLLVFFSSLIIIFFDYKRSYQEIELVSQELIEQVSQGLMDKINNVTDQALLVSSVTKKVITDLKDIKGNSEFLVSYLLNLLSVDPMLFGVNLATEDGYFIGVINLKLAGISHYFSRPSELLPSTAKYAVRVIDNTTAVPTEIWQYLGPDMQFLATEVVNPVSYNSRHDPWYIKMKEHPAVRWENTWLPKGLSRESESVQSCISVAMPLLGRDGALAAVISVNVSLNFLSSYIAHQKIGKTGVAFVLDRKGNLLIPNEDYLTPASHQLALKLLPSVYEQYAHHRQQHFHLQDGSVKYIIYIHRFPISLENEWITVIAVPFTDFFGTVVKTQKQTILISLAILLVFGSLVFFVSKRISVPIIQLANEVDRMRHFDFQAHQAIQSKIHEIGILDSSIAAMRSALLSFGKYVPKEIVMTLMQQQKVIGLGGEKAELCVMFTDITNFTTFAETQPIEEVMSSLSLYFDALSKVILNAEGTIDKYIGDSIMAFWGAPSHVEDPVRKACLTALQAHRMCNLEFEKSGLPHWKTRFGIHTGEVIVGNIGTNERMNYTVIGDVVNTTSRLTSINKQYQTSIIISDVVQRQIGDGFITRPLDFVAVKGKAIKLTIYELVGTVSGPFAASAEQVELCRAFTEAYEKLHAGQGEEGKALFQKLAERFPGDVPTKIILEGLNSGQQ